MHALLLVWSLTIVGALVVGVMRFQRQGDTAVQPQKKIR